MSSNHKLQLCGGYCNAKIRIQDMFNSYNFTSSSTDTPLSLGTLISSTNKTDCHEIIEIHVLLKP